MSADQNRSVIDPNEDQDRREFLAACGNFAVVTSPAITALLSTSLNSAAVAQSGGRLHKGREYGDSRHHEGRPRRQRSQLLNPAIRGYVDLGGAATLRAISHLAPLTPSERTPRLSPTDVRGSGIWNTRRFSIESALDAYLREKHRSAVFSGID